MSTFCQFKWSAGHDIYSSITVSCNSKNKSLGWRIRSIFLLLTVACAPHHSLFLVVVLLPCDFRKAYAWSGRNKNSAKATSCESLELWTGESVRSFPENNRWTICPIAANGSPSLEPYNCKNLSIYKYRLISVI